MTEDKERVRGSHRSRSNTMTTPYGRIYLVTNTVTGKVYVGQTKQTLQRRWKQHSSGKHCRRLVASINYHGPDNFTIKELATATSLEELNRLETFWIQLLKSNLALFGYNLMLGGDARTHSEETRKKMSGRVVSKQTRQRLSKALMGRALSEETRQKLSVSQKGRTHSEKTRKEMSMARKGRPSPLRGRTVSEEQRRKISQSLKGNKNRTGQAFSEETRKKMSEAAKARWRRNKEVKLLESQISLMEWKEAA